MIHYDFHAEATARFAQDTRPAVVGKVLKAAAVTELVIDGLQTQSFLHRGICKEIDPIAKPFVHYLPLAVVASAGVSYLIVHLPDSKLSHVLLGVFVAGEAANITHNHTNGCN
jgi:hypothetical protein